MEPETMTTPPSGSSRVTAAWVPTSGTDGVPANLPVADSRFSRVLLAISEMHRHRRRCHVGTHRGGRPGDGRCCYATTHMGSDYFMSGYAENPMYRASSADGTVIAYDKVGEGPALVLIEGALNDLST